MNCEIKIGDLVRVKDVRLVTPLHIGNIGVVTDDSRADVEVEVSHTNGILWWSVENLEVISESR